MHISHLQKPLLLVIASLFTGFFSNSVKAHVDLQSPQARYASRTENKACPCGVGNAGNSRTCALPNDRSDPDRSTDRVTTVVAGSTLVFRFEEYVGHSGRWRIAFDADGADQADFNNTILADIPDPAGSTGNIGDGSMWEIEVTVPNTPCDNCTFQLIQMMDGNTTEPVADPIGRSTYYQCADVTIVAAGSTADAGAPVVADDAGAPIVADDAGAPVVADDAGAPVVADDAGTPIVADDAGAPVVADDAGAPVTDDDTPADVGCSCTLKNATNQNIGFSVLAFVVLAMSFRKRRYVR